MAQCRNCGRSGIFLSVDTNGVCGNCRPFYICDVQENGRLMMESIELVNSSKKLETRLSRCDFVIKCAERLIPYEQKGIRTIDPPPSVLIQKIRAKRDGVIVETLNREAESVFDKLRVTPSPKTKITALTKLLLRVRDYQSQCSDPEALASLGGKTLELVHQIQLSAYLEAAEKAEFKGQKKKALDQYYEAPYFLRHDEIDDSLQREQTTEIEAKIAELDGKVIEQSQESTALVATDTDF